MRRRVPLLLSALLVCSLALGAAPAAGQPQPDGTHFEAQLESDGDAVWTVEVRFPIEDEAEREEFEAFAERFEAGGGDVELGVDAFERAAAEAEAASGRSMSIGGVSRTSEVLNGTDESRYGVLRVSFTWSSFARVGDDGTMYVDDAFNTTEGTWLSGLGADQTLTIRAPPDYGPPTTSPIGAEGGDLRWEGPRTFEPGYFEIVYEPGAAPEDGFSTALIVGALALSAAALLVGLYLLFVRRRDGGAEGGDAPDPSPDPNPAPATDPDPDPSPPSDDAPDATGATADPESGEDIDLDLVSDEERVEYLLERNGGRMKQATIVKETGWSNAKVSQLLSGMDETDRIDKLRIGRENLISLPGEGLGDIEDGDDGGDG